MTAADTYANPRALVSTDWVAETAIRNSQFHDNIKLSISQLESER